jgi:N-acylneuraminate cytidylyltransferase
MLRKNVDGVISITDYEFPPSLGLLEDESRHLIAYDKSDPWRTGNSRSQDHPDVHRPNGAIYGMWSKSFDKYRNFYKGKVVGYHMPRERSVDIDTKFDFLVAESIIKDNN